MRKVDPVKHEAKRLEILQAAGRCFLRDGFRGASVSSICKEAGISAGHLYHYFDNKEAMIEAMIETELSRAAILRVAPTADPVVVLLEEFERRIAFRGGALLFDVLAEASRNPAIAGLVRRQSRIVHGWVAELLRRGQEQGHVEATLDVDATVRILVCWMDAAKAMVIRDPDLDPRATTQSGEQFLLRLLRPIG